MAKQGKRAMGAKKHIEPHDHKNEGPGARDGWLRLAKNLKAGIDGELIENYRGTLSLPFEPGARRLAAVKMLDDRGIESLKIVEAG